MIVYSIHCKYNGPSTLECIVIVYTKLFKYTQYTRVYSDGVQYTLQVHQTQYTRTLQVHRTQYTRVYSDCVH